MAAAWLPAVALPAVAWWPWPVAAWLPAAPAVPFPLRLSKNSSSGFWDTGSELLYFCTKYFSKRIKFRRLHL